MFGYVRPNRDELKVRELRDYEALYCGLCHACLLYTSPSPRDCS